MSRINWPEYAMAIAKAASLRSEDPYIQVGACILRHDFSVAACGYNGAPPGVNIDWSDREERRIRVIHAETNALRHTGPGEGRLIAVTLKPCSDCLKNIASYGIKEVFYLQDYYRDTMSQKLAEEFGITMTQIG
jgi:dCMP deaminase